MNGFIFTCLITLSLSLSAARPTEFDARMGHHLNGEDCVDCVGFPAGFSETKRLEDYVQVASLDGSLGGIDSDPLKGKNDSICGLASNNSWNEFAKEVDKYKVDKSDAIAKSRCQTFYGDGTKKMHPILHTVVYEKGTPSAFTAGVVKHLYKTNQVDILVGLIQGVDGQRTLFEEMKYVHDVAKAQPKKRKEIEKMGRILCRVIEKKLMNDLNEMYQSNCPGVYL